MSSCISPQQLERYHQDGILFPLEVLTEVEVQSFRSALEEFEQTFFAGPQKRISNLHLFFPWAFHLATHPRLLDTVEAILGDDILIDGTLVFGKLPHNPSYATWHQDSLYSGWHLTPSVSAWIALSDSTAENGCMRAIPGTHMQGVLPHTNIRDGANLLRRGGTGICCHRRNCKRRHHPQCRTNVTAPLQCHPRFQTQSIERSPHWFHHPFCYQPYPRFRSSPAARERYWQLRSPENGRPSQPR